MNEQELVDNMLAMSAAQNPSPNGSTDPVDTANNADSSLEAQPQATEGAPTDSAQAAASDKQGKGEVGGTSPQSAPSSPKEEKIVDLEETFEKSNRAFAEQRLKLKQQDDLLMRFAHAANMDAKNAEEAYAMLSGIITQQEAKSKNLDPIVLKTLQEQEAKLMKYEQEEIKKEANASFQDLQKTFNLDAREITSFAKQLSAEGINPFTTRGINLSQHYLSMNYPKLIERAREQGRKEEAERQKRVAQSTSPSQSMGQSPATQTEHTVVSTGNGFDDFAKILGIR